MFLTFDMAGYAQYANIIHQYKNNLQRCETEQTKITVLL
jgi:hypothetical protein